MPPNHSSSSPDVFIPFSSIDRVLGLGGSIRPAAVTALARWTRRGRGKLDYLSPCHQFLYLVGLLGRKLIARNSRKFCKSAHVRRGPKLPGESHADLSEHTAILPRSAVAYRRLQGKHPILGAFPASQQSDDSRQMNVDVRDHLQFGRCALPICRCAESEVLRRAQLGLDPGGPNRATIVRHTGGECRQAISAPCCDQGFAHFIVAWSEAARLRSVQVKFGLQLTVG